MIVTTPRLGECVSGAILTFWFACAIQQPALEIWRGQVFNAPAAQKALFHLAPSNRATRCGECDAVNDAVAPQLILKSRP